MRKSFDLDLIRTRLSQAQGRQYWRSLEELADTPEFREMLQREFPAGASEWWDGLSRRNFLRLSGALMALAGLTACTKQPPHEILPYVKQPEELVPGEPLFYATAMPLDGFAQPVLVKSREGHPIKIEGNPEHTSTRGASNVWMQASILGLYDPDRAQSVTHLGDLSTWALFLDELNELVKEETQRQGAGLRFLTETVTSPTLAWQLRELVRKFPLARWHQYEPAGRDNVREGARLAFGEVVETHYRFDKAAVIVALDSDFLYTHPDGLRHAHDFAEGRRVDSNSQLMNRLYAIESSPTVSGAMAEHRFPLASSEIEGFARHLARELGAFPAAVKGPAIPWQAALVRDLQQHAGRSIVIAGESQPPAVHALVHAINQHLGNVGHTLAYTESAEAHPVNQLASLRELTADIEAGNVRNLVILGGNPAYTAPADLQFAQHLEKVPRSILLGPELDETASLCTWYIPQSHYLESWGDGRAFEGTVSITQPLIAPLYNGKTAYELLGAFSQQQPVRSDYEIVREHWRQQGLWPDFERGWRKVLHDGFIDGTACRPKQVSLRTAAITAALSRPEPDSAADEFNSAKSVAKSSPARLDENRGLELNFRLDPCVWDGRFANNGWLQECPKPITKLTWDNALLISPALAQNASLASGDVVDLHLNDRSLRAPVWIMPGQARNAVTLYLGHGRSRVGRVGKGVGVNANRLRTSTGFWFNSGAQLVKVPGAHPLVTTQAHHAIDSEERQVYRAGSFAKFLAEPRFLTPTIEAPGKEETLYDPEEFPRQGPQWGMSIDLTTCIGCNACLVACEVENNIPVVGKDQVGRRREMFWIRVDTYFEGNPDHPQFNHQPVPCMHCEHAPCELVCPVAATVHDHEGLNLQVYNRCVGTRFCSNNCPYKVRRFNFYQYTDYNQPSLKALYNPEVTVRWRGVMEKCTYCIQRISRARIAAEKANRPIGDGEVQTACQQACPARAIVFGNLNDPESRVARLKAHPLDYPMLGALNTRPRTTYLAKIRNPNPDITEPYGNDSRV